MVSIILSFSPRRIRCIVMRTMSTATIPKRWYISLFKLWDTHPQANLVVPGDLFPGQGCMRWQGGPEAPSGSRNQLTSDWVPAKAG